MAGVINIITKKGADKENNFNVFGKIGYGAFNTFNSNIGLRGDLKILDYNLSYQRFSTDGLSEAEKPTNNQDFDNDGYVQNAYQVNLGFKPNKKIRIHPFLRYNIFEGEFDSGAFSDDPDDNYEIKLLNTGLKGELMLDKFYLSANYVFTDTDRTFRFQNMTDISRSLFKGQFNNIDIFGNYSFSDKIQLLGGINNQYSVSSDLGDAVSIHESTNLFSPYLNVLIQNLGGFYLELGGRYNNHNLYGKNFVYNTSAAYNYKNHKLLIAYTTGFKAPTLYQLYGPFGLGNDELNPQTSKSFEAGWQGNVLNDKLQLRAVYFKRNIENLITFNSLFNYTNQGQQKNEGVEVTVDINLKKWHISGNYNFVTGKDLLRVPKHNFSFNYGYQITSEWAVGLQIHYFDRRTDRFFNNTTFMVDEVILDSYFLLNFHSHYSLWNKKLTTFLDVKNLTNTKYNELAGYSTLPINLHGGIRFNF